MGLEPTAELWRLGRHAENGLTQGAYVAINSLCSSFEGTPRGITPWYDEPMLDTWGFYGWCHNASMDRESFQAETEVLKQQGQETPRTQGRTPRTQGRTLTVCATKCKVQIPNYKHLFHLRRVMQSSTCCWPSNMEAFSLPGLSLLSVISIVPIPKHDKKKKKEFQGFITSSYKFSLSTSLNQELFLALGIQQ